MRLARRALALATFAFLAACATKPLPPSTPPTPVPAPAPAPAPAPVPVPGPPTGPIPPNARAAGVTIEAPRTLPRDEAARALAAFRASCPSLVRRQDSSGLTAPGDWSALCTQAASLADEYAPGFFYYNFDWVRVGDGRAFATGYYEPEIEGSRTQLPGYVPVYRVPPDLIRCTKPDGTSGRGRIDQTGTCVLYFTRAEIEDGALAGKNLEVAWAADPVELFFVEVQGSGRIRLPDGNVMRIGYAGQNGRDYVAIGRQLRDRGILPPGGANMQAIKDWIRANPDAGKALMRENTVLHLLPGADRAGAARFAGRCDHAARDGCRRSQFRSAGRARLSQDGPSRGRRIVGRAGRRRCDQGTQPLRHLLGRWTGSNRARRRNVGLGPGADPVAQGRGGQGRRPLRPLSPEEAKLWAEVAATIRPLSRERLNPPRNGEGDLLSRRRRVVEGAHGRAASTVGPLHRPLRGRFPSPSRGGIPSMAAGTSASAQARPVPTGCSICTA